MVKLVKLYVFILYAQSSIFLKMVSWKTMILSPEISTFVVVLKKGEENMCLYLQVLHREIGFHTFTNSVNILYLVLHPVRPRNCELRFQWVILVGLSIRRKCILCILYDASH